MQNFCDESDYGFSIFFKGLIVTFKAHFISIVWSD